MTGKPQKNWAEIQLAIAAAAITATIGFWNLFSAGQKQQVTATSADTQVPPAEEMAQVAAPSATPGFIPVKIIFGGSAPQQRVVVQQAQVNAPKSHKGAPKPGVSTGSSKP